MASGDTLLVWKATDGIPPAANYATLDARNIHPVLDFDASTEESIYFEGVLPRHYDGGGVTVAITWMATSATTGGTVWGISFERMNTDLDADSFATEQLSGTSSANGTSGITSTVTTNISDGANMDSVAVGEVLRVKIARKIGEAGDDMSGDAELVAVHIYEQ